MTGWRAATAVTLVLGAALPAAAQGPSSIEAGHQIAVEICSACHQVSPDQKFPPLLNSRPPSFEEIANRPGVSPQTLRRFISTTHWDEKRLPMTMPAAFLTPEQLDEVTGYIMSLRRGKGQPGTP
jgi:mono/diheme cytochrome c family protein